jgi:ERO1-like protein alpha
MICNFHTCTVCQCEENEIPLPWKQDSENDDVDKKIGEKFYQWVEKYNYSSVQWLVENEIDSRKGIYVNLIKNPESYTGYQGQNIWNAIYHENCFSNKFDQLCTEEKVFYKIISGFHSNINLHLSQNYFDIHRNISYLNATMMTERVLDHKDRINNLFFLHSLLIKAIYKSKELIENYDIYTGNKNEDLNTKNIISNLLNNKTIENYYDEGIEDSENYKKFLRFHKVDQIKMRFRNISSIIDCVSCQKCKLHGKLQIYGLATMLKILFNTGNNLTLKRNELISFVNLVGKVSKSIKYMSDYLEILEENSKMLKLAYLIVFIFVLFFMIFINIYLLLNRNKLDKNYDLRNIKNNKEISTNTNKNKNSINKSDDRKLEKEIELIQIKENDFVIDNSKNKKKID